MYTYNILQSVHSLHMHVLLDLFIFQAKEREGAHKKYTFSTSSQCFTFSVVALLKPWPHLKSSGFSFSSEEWPLPIWLNISLQWILKLFKTLKDNASVSYLDAIKCSWGFLWESLVSRGNRLKQHSTFKKNKPVNMPNSQPHIQDPNCKPSPWEWSNYQMFKIGHI